MKYFTILAVLSVLATSNAVLRRQEAELAPDSVANSEQVTACKKPSLELQRAWQQNGCEGTNDGGQDGSTASESHSPACDKAMVDFVQAWADNNCEEALNAAINNLSTPAGRSDSSTPTSEIIN
ncbi:uncharacterized protein G6M90_00g054250 [Metarhizium brunneum]|uniref:Small secreted protein n=1 Tax=Metarhizium brunneum TaxID=500148 RepID=A0A7D5UXY6_9HYPO